MKATVEAFGLALCIALLFLWTLAYCGKPDLHDKLLQWADKELAKTEVTR